MMKRTELVAFLDEYLDIADVVDKSFNGLQVEGAEEVSRISFAVDFCLASAEAARKQSSQMLVVHHGFFWGKVEPLTGHRLRQISALLKGELNLYAAHLPLDAHPEVGNNIQLARMLDLRNIAPFGRYNGLDIGVTGELPGPLKPDDLARRLDKLLQGKTQVFKFGSRKINRVAVVSGDAASLAEEAANAQADAFITGEISHTAYHVVQERGIHLLCAGHYATETVGLRALAARLQQEFSLETRWIDLPTGV